MTLSAVKDKRRYFEKCVLTVEVNGGPCGFILPNIFGVLQKQEGHTGLVNINDSHEKRGKPNHRSKNVSVFVSWLFGSFSVAAVLMSSYCIPFD